MIAAVHNRQILIVMLAILMSLSLPSLLLAQGGASAGQGAGAGQGTGNTGQGTGDQDQDRDQLRDQTCVDGVDCEPVQDRDRLQDQTCIGGVDCDQLQTRDQDRDRAQDPVFLNTDGPDQLQDRDRDQLRDQTCVDGVDCEPVQDRDQDRLNQQIRTPEELRTTISAEQQRLQVGSQATSAGAVQMMNQNQNQVRVAVQAFMASEEILGDIGPAVARIAQEYDSSVEATIRAEEQVQNRSRLARLFFGSDDEVVQNFENQLDQNNARVRDLTQFMQNWDGDEQVKMLLQEQIQTMEQEQLRLQSIVDEEKARTGIFGFLFGWL